MFSELRLNGLATDPLGGDSRDLPYHNMQHLRDCLQQISTTHKESKLVTKEMSEGVLYRMVKNGFYVGDHYEFACYRFPPEEQLEREHRTWWRSAQARPMSWR